MAKIRFALPESSEDPNLEIPAVPAQFIDRICDIEETDLAALGRMRYRGQPYGVVQLGLVTGTTSPTGGGLSRAEIASDVRTPSTTIGAAVTERLAPTTALIGQVSALRSDVDGLLSAPGGGGGGGIVVGNELPTSLETGTLGARLRTY